MNLDNINCKCELYVHLEFNKSMEALPLLSIGSFNFLTEDNKELSFDFTDVAIYVNECHLEYELRNIDDYYSPLTGKDILETLPKITKFDNLFIDEDWEGPTDIKVKAVKEFSLSFYADGKLPNIPDTEFWKFELSALNESRDYMTAEATESLLKGCVDKEWME